MSDQTNGAAAPTRRTRRHHFFYYTYRQDTLFSVREGVPFEEALSEASCFLATAVDLAYEAAMTGNGAKYLFAVAYLVEISKAIVDAAHMTVNEENRHE